jgi:hypothetical protein
MTYDQRRHYVKESITMRKFVSYLETLAYLEKFRGNAAQSTDPDEREKYLKAIDSTKERLLAGWGMALDITEVETYVNGETGV